MMNELFKKLNYKDQKQVFVINAPKSFDENLNSLGNDVTVMRSVGNDDKPAFVIAFVVTQQQLDETVLRVAPRLQGDAIFWMCYPKGSSKKLKSEINRDRGWDIMGKFNLEGVRQVSIDEDWSALRFRKVEYIKTFSRSSKMALSEAGKSRTSKDD